MNLLTLSNLFMCASTLSPHVTYIKTYVTFLFWMSHVACHEDATCPYPYNKPTEFQEIL